VVRQRLHVQGVQPIVPSLAGGLTPFLAGGKPGGVPRHGFKIVFLSGSGIFFQVSRSQRIERSRAPTPNAPAKRKKWFCQKYIKAASGCHRTKLGFDLGRKDRARASNFQQMLEMRCDNCAFFAMALPL
jgi:hypothetical protein